MLKRPWVVLCLLVAGADQLQAQTRDLCAEGVAVVQDSVAATGERAQGLRKLIYCDEQVAGAPLSEELRRLGSRTDIYNMDWLVTGMLLERHPLVLETALELVSDGGATTPGRVAAMRVFVQYHRPSSRMPIEKLIPDQRPGRYPGVCRPSTVMNHGGTRDMAPLPEGWSSTVERVLRLIEDDTEEPRGVREAAHCALLLMSIRDQN